MAKHHRVSAEVAHRLRWRQFERGRLVVRWTLPPRATVGPPVTPRGAQLWRIGQILAQDSDLVADHCRSIDQVLQPPMRRLPPPSPPLGYKWQSAACCPAL